MKKQFLLTLITILFYQFTAMSQWTPNTNSIFSNIGRAGKVGIGLTSSSTISERLSVGGSLKVTGEIKGYRSSSQSFGIFGNTASNNGSYIRLYGPSSGQITLTSYASGSIRFYNYLTGWKSLMEMKSNGKIIMGNASSAPSGFLLSVDDGIITQQIKVCPSSSSWCDYVFEEDYHRNTIQEVETFVKENKHLPNVPSAEEVGKEGLNVAEMDAVLLRQIEELWLNMIDMNKEVNSLKEENDVLKKKLREMNGE